MVKRSDDDEQEEILGYRDFWPRWDGPKDVKILENHQFGKSLTMADLHRLERIKRDGQGDQLFPKVEVDSLIEESGYTTRIEVSTPHPLKVHEQHALGELFARWYKVRNDNPAVEPAFSEDDLMGFGKRKGNLPSHIKDLDYGQLHNSQVWCMADWMGCKRNIAGLNKEELRRAELKKVCEDNLDKAQKGYNVICLLKTGGSDLSTTADQKALDMLGNVISKHIEHIDDKAEIAVREHAKDVMDGLAGAARKALQTAADNARPIVIEEGKQRRKVKGVLPPEFERMVQLASARIPILLVGPAGCGKTYLSEKLGEALGFEFSDQSCSEGMSESVFNGLLLPLGKNGEFKHVPSPFMDRYESGGVMLLDEMDAGDPNLFTYINKAIANKSYTVPQRYTAPVVKKHKDFVLIAAANTFGHGADSMYVGRNQLDAATLDRFKVGLINLDYCREVEETLADDSLCKWAWAIRDRIRTNKLRRIMSTRVINDLGVMTERYKWKQPEWERAYFAGWSDNDRRAVGVTV